MTFQRTALGLLACLSIEVKATVVFQDDFNRSLTNSTIVGNGWLELNTGLGDGAIATNKLVLKNGATSGRTYVSQSFTNFSSPFVGTLGQNLDQVVWNFNMQSTRGGFNTLSGFDYGQYGIGFVLAGSSSDLLGGTGYAVVWGQSGSTPLRLVQFNAGLTNNAALSNLIVAGTPPFDNVGTFYLSVRVTYDPATGAWQLWGRNDGTTGFADPASGTLTLLGQATNNTYTGQPLGWMGALWNYNTTLSQWAWFDNFSVQVLSRPPSIVTQPQSQLALLNGSVSLNAGVVGTRPLSYQWYFNGVASGGQTNATFTLPGFQLSNEGSYRVVVTNNYGSVTSAVATLTVSRDFGDAPDPAYPTLLANNGARHIIVPGVYLGSGVSADSEGKPNATAAGDDLDDGVIFTNTIVAGQTATVKVVASTAGYLNAWVDFSQDGSWTQAADQIFTDQPLLTGTNTLTFGVPYYAATGTTFARFRFSTTNGLSFAGLAPDGEVEDYALTISPATATKLLAGTQPPAFATAGVPFDPPPSIYVADNLGQPVYSDSTTVVTATRLSGAGALQGTLTATANHGLATFTNLYHTLATNITIKFTSGSLTSVTSGVVEVDAGPASQLGIKTQPSAAATAGSAFATQPVVQVFDAYGNLNTNGAAGAVVTVSRNLGAGTLQGSTSATVAANGLTTFSGLFHTVANTINLKFDSAGLASAVSSNILVSPATATRLAFTTDPAQATVGHPFGTQPVVTSQDSFGNDSTVGLPDTLMVTNLLVGHEELLQGTATLDIGTSAGNGSVVYTNLEIDTAGTNYQLLAASAGLSNALSSVFTVAKGSQTITFDPIPNKTYGDAPFAVQATASSGLPVSVDVFLGAASISNQTVTITGSGNITLRASQAGDDKWNAAPSVFQSFSAARAILTVTADNKSKVYGSANPQLTAQYNGFAYRENISVISGAPVISTTATNISTVTGGPYPITVHAGTLIAQNYLFSFVSGNLAVTPAPLTVTETNKSRVYGSANPVLTGSISGILNNDNITASYATTATPDSQVGTYQIFPIFADPDGRLPNYTTNIPNGTLTITNSVLIVAADNAVRSYGSTNPIFTGVLSGIQNGDNISAAYATTATTNSPVGAYPIIPTLIGPDDKLTNYTVLTTNGTLNVTPVTITITADDKTKLFGAPLPEMTATYTGFVPGEDTNSLTSVAALTTTATAVSDVGAYQITASGAASPNYTFNYIGGTLTIGQSFTVGAITASANPAAAGSNLTFTMSVSAAAPGAGTPGGSVNFRIDGNIAGAGTLSGNTTAFSLNTLAAGSHTVVAEYAGDLNFIGTTNTLTPDLSIIRLLAAGNVSSERYPRQGTKLAFATLLASVSGTDGESLSITVSSNSVNGGMITVNEGWVFYTPAEGFTNADSFTYTVTDGIGGSAIGTVSVGIINVDNEAGMNLAVADLPNGSAQINGYGIPGRTYTIQFTDNPETPVWQTLGTATADATGFFEIIDTPPANSPPRFYRSTSQSP